MFLDAFICLSVFTISPKFMNIFSGIFYVWVGPCQIINDYIFVKISDHNFTEFSTIII